MKKTTSLKLRISRMLIGNPIGSLVIAYIKNPLYFLYTGLGIVVMLLSFERSFSERPVEAGFFSGKIIFGKDQYHRIQSKDVNAQLKSELGAKALTLTATKEDNLESVYLKIYNMNGPGTYFIPGDGEIGNIGNLIKNLDKYTDKNNFYESSLPNKEGVQNGVGRVNITRITEHEIEGELILIANNPQGEQAILESAKFKIPLH
jgi:hypothetical protein